VVTHFTYEERVTDFDWALSETSSVSAGMDASTSAGTAATASASSGGHTSPPSFGRTSPASAAVYTFDDLRVLPTPSLASSRVSVWCPASACACSWIASPTLHRLPRDPEMGAIAQPAVLRVRRGLAVDPPRERRNDRNHHPEKHVHKVRKIRDRLPALKHVVVWTPGTRRLQPARPRWPSTPCLGSTTSRSTFDRRDPVGAALYLGQTGQPKGAQQSTTLWSQYSPPNGCSTSAGRHLLVQTRTPVG